MCVCGDTFVCVRVYCKRNTMMCVCVHAVIIKRTAVVAIPSHLMRLFQMCWEVSHVLGTMAMLSSSPSICICSFVSVSESDIA